MRVQVSLPPKKSFEKRIHCLTANFTNKVNQRISKSFIQNKILFEDDLEILFFSFFYLEFQIFWRV